MNNENLNNNIPQDTSINQNMNANPLGNVPMQNPVPEPVVSTEVPMVQQQPVINQAPTNFENTNIQAEQPVTNTEVPQMMPQTPMQNPNPAPTMNTEVPQMMPQTPMQNPNPAPVYEYTPEQAPKKNPLGILIILIIIAVAGYFGYTKFFANSDSESNSDSKNASCIDNFETSGYMTTDGKMAVEQGDTQYIFDSKFDFDLLDVAFHSDDIRVKVCYSDMDDSSVNFHVGNTTKSSKVVSFELYNKADNKKIEAKTANDLIAELGYHSVGEHTEEATVIEKSDFPGVGFSGDKTYTYYTLTIEFSNGKKVEADYVIYQGQTSKIDQLEVGKKYTFNFNVEEDTFEILKYTITNFN